MDSGNGEPVHNIGKVNEDNKKSKLEMVINAVCAMLNTNGGKVVVNIEPDSNLSLIELLEESLISIIGNNQTVKKIDFDQNEEHITVLVKERADFLVTKNYNLYLPGEKRVMKVSSHEPLENVLCDIIERKVVEEPFQPLQHTSFHTSFIKGTHCNFSESKTIQLKNIKAEKSNRKTLAHRMTNKINKLSRYVSAFANYRGGCIYFGINDDGVIEGEVISQGKDQRKPAQIVDKGNAEKMIQAEQKKIISKVEKTIKKLIWSGDIVPALDDHWKIFFKSVLDEKRKPIPSTFVIVIYIAPFFGGVFTEEPECYQFEEGKVKRMSFALWKEAILQPIRLRRTIRHLPQSVQPIAWSSTKTQEDFVSVSEKLRDRTDRSYFQVLLLYLEAVLARASGNFKSMNSILRLCHR